MELQKLVATLSFCMLVFSGCSSTLSFAAAQRPQRRSTPVRDTAGRPIAKGTWYYIKPVDPKHGGALAMVTRNYGPACPKFVGQVQDRRAKGTPVSFGGLAVNEDWDVTITFEGTWKPCPQQSTWKAGSQITGTGSGLIEVGGGTPADVTFKITNYNGLYHIAKCHSGNECELAGIVGENGVSLLAQGDPAVPLAFKFERV